MLTEKEIPSIPKFFHGKSVFITGGSGFIGKVLIEKLLRDCSGIDNIFVLIREKRGKSPQQRVEDIVNIPLFDKLREKDSDATKKIVPIYGDTAKINLGISEEDTDTLISKANIVYHCAATVRFDDHLRSAIFTNIRGTREVITLAKQFKHLDVFVHVSTTYCNLSEKVIDEKIYPAMADWRDVLYTAENADSTVLEALTLKYIHPFPNTYTFTKFLAEHTVEDLCKDQIPAIIYRPSIVVNTVADPFPGWLDNFNGPFSLCIGGMKGLFSCMAADPFVLQDMVAVDNLARSLAVATWHKAITKLNKHEVTIYNAAGDCSWEVRHYADFGERMLFEVPFKDRLWYGGNVLITKCWYYYYVCFIFCDLVPGLLLDGLLKISGRETLLVKLLRKGYIGIMALAFFLQNTLTFRNDKYSELEKKLLEEDKPQFMFRRVSFKSVEEVFDITKQNIIGARKYLLKETPTEQTYSNTKRFYFVDRAVKLIAYGWLLYWIFWKCDIIGVIARKTYDYFSALET